MTIIFIILLFFLSACSMPYQLELRSAKSRERKSDYEGAIKAYQKIVDSKPNSVQARKAQLAIGEIYYEKLAQKEKALEIFQKILDESLNTPESNQVLWKLGTHFFKMGEYEKAKESFYKIFVSVPHSEIGIEAQLILAKCYEELKEYAMAAQTYNAFALLHPEHPTSADALLNAARIYSEKLKRSYDAIKAYQNIIKRYGNNRELSSIIMNAKSQLMALKADVPLPNPDRLGTYEGRRQERREIRRKGLKKPLDPLKAFHESAKAQNVPIFGRNVKDLIREVEDMVFFGYTEGGTIWDAMETVANMYYQEEEYAKAGTLYLKMSEKSFQDASIYWKLGRCYQNLGFIEKARESYKTAVSIDKSVLQQMITSVEKEYDLENYDEAISRYKALLGLGKSEDDSLIYHRIGLAYLKLKDLQKALEAFECSVAWQPTVSNQDSLQHMAEIFEELGKPLKAAIYQDAADGKTNDFKVEWELGDLCHRYESYDWARIKYQAASNLTSDSKLSTDMKVKAALIAAKKGMRDLAKNELIKLNSEFKDKASVHYGFGVLAYDDGNFDEAILEFNKALQYEPDYGEAKIALEKALRNSQ